MPGRVSYPFRLVLLVLTLPSHAFMGVTIMSQQRLIGVLALDITGGQITSISSIVNPDKLTHLGPVADFRSLLRSAR